jgi:nascent polypeptide-associated complex subunit alpha
VIIKTASKDIVIEEPNVTMVTVQGQAMYQIAGGQVTEEVPAPQAPTTTAVPSEADVQLVAQQTGKSMDESRNALVAAGGDLAKAILSLKGQSTATSS